MMVLTMDDVQFNNWKQFVTETLADVAIRQQAAEKRMEASEKRMDRFERNLTRLARLGQRARSGLKHRQEEQESRQAEHERWQRENEKWQAIIDRNMAEITDKLNGLIGHVQNQHPPQQ